VITEKDREKLDRLIERKRVDLEILQKESLDTYANINYLYITDRITMSELARYWNLNRSTVYRKYKKDIKEQVKVNKIIKQYRSKSLAELAPEKVFYALSEYAEFLKWRSNGNGKHFISVNKVARILRTSRSQVHRMIRNGELHGLKEKGDYKVLVSSLRLYISDTIKELEAHINRLSRFLKLY
jgi:predicted DNA-binding transcriptional regulator AlpA